MEFLTENKLPIGRYVKEAVDWLIAHAGWLFDGISAVLDAVISAILFVLQLPHPLVMVVLVAGLAWWLRRSVGLVVFTVLSLLYIINQGYWKETTETLALVGASTFLAMAIGIPTGILAARKPWLMTAMRPVLDLMQTLPTFTYLIPTLILFGLGMVPGLISTVIFAVPASIRLTHLGISTTPTSLVEAAESFGATPWQRLIKVEIPWAMPQILAGLTQTIMLSLSMVVIAALVGASGLGVPVLRALNSVNIAMGFTAGLAIVLLAIILDRLCRGDEKGLRR